MSSEFEIEVATDAKVTKTLVVKIARDKEPGFYAGTHQWGGMDTEDAQAVDEVVKACRELLKQAGVRVGGKGSDLAIEGGRDEVIATECVLTFANQMLNQMAIVKSKASGIELPLTDAVLAAIEKAKS